MYNVGIKRWTSTWIQANREAFGDQFGQNEPGRGFESKNYWRRSLARDEASRIAAVDCRSDRLGGDLAPIRTEFSRYFHMFLFL